jgi:hypothetical protein
VENNEVQAQVELIRSDALADQNIGDTPIKWDSCMGDPEAVANAEFDGNNFTAYYDNINLGVYLTEATADTKGSLYWDKDFDYTKNIYISGTFLAGGEGLVNDDGDGITVFFGVDDSLTVSSDATNGIAVFFDEYNDDVVKVYKNGVLIDTTFYTNLTLDDLQWRKFEIIYEYIDSSSAFVQVQIDNVYVCRVDVGSWVGDAGTYIGASGVCGSADNNHQCKSFDVKNANPWLALNR